MSPEVNHVHLRESLRNYKGVSWGGWRQLRSGDRKIYSLQASIVTNVKGRVSAEWLSYSGPHVEGNLLTLAFMIFKRVRTAGGVLEHLEESDR
jgi:hypothetical protein